MNTPHSDPELEARIADLATGFAIGDLSEDELRDFYDLLRDEQGNGPRAAQVAWQTLGMVTDIRSQVSSTFQDTVVMRLQQASMSGRFTNALFKRLGMRSGTLQPVETPQQQKTPLRIALWLAVAVVAGALLAGGIGLLWSAARGAHATVTALHGSATIAGQSLTPGADVDHRSLVVKPGGQLTLLWADGSSVVIAGGDDEDSVATVRGDGLVLLRGQIWITGRRGFTLVLPDRHCRVDLDGSSISAQVVAQRGFVGVRRGALSDDRLGSVLAENMGSSPAGVYRWQWEWDLLSGRLAGGGPPPPDWRLGGEIIWHDLTDTVRMVLAAAGQPAGERGLELRVVPGLVAVLDQGQEVQRLTLTGSPLLGMRLHLRQSDARTLTVAVDELSLTVPLRAPIGGYRLHVDGGAMVKVEAFHPLPAPRPPLPAPGW